MTPEEKLEDKLYDIFARRVDWGDAIEEIKALFISAMPEEDICEAPVHLKYNMPMCNMGGCMECEYVKEDK